MIHGIWYHPEDPHDPWRLAQDLWPPRIHAELKAEGVAIGKKRVAG